MKKGPYREAVGSLNYCAVATRPDIAFSVSLLAQFMDNPRHIHCEGIKQFFRYLLGTKNWELTYGTTENWLEGYTDADGFSQEHRHAISGYILGLFTVAFFSHFSFHFSVILMIPIIFLYFFLSFSSMVAIKS